MTTIKVYISDDIDEMIELNKEADPKDLVKNSRLIDLEEDTIKQGLPKVLEMAYAGELGIDNYITLLGNMYLARTISYELPEKPDMKKLEVGVKKCLEMVCNSNEPDTRIRKMIPPDDIPLLSEDEKRIYMTICHFRDKELQMFSINRRKYLSALKSKNMTEVYECENKRFNIFDEETAEAAADCFRNLPNSARPLFAEIFENMWGLKIGSKDLLIKESISGFEKMNDLLLQIKSDEKRTGYGLKAALTKNFIQIVEKIVVQMKEKMSEIKTSNICE